jgi:hypothetical protein
VNTAVGLAFEVIGLNWTWGQLGIPLSIRVMQSQTSKLLSSIKIDSDIQVDVDGRIILKLNV